MHVAGRVRSPGVYTLSGGARLVDAVAAAGGALRDADLEALNLAALAVDGTQIFVPRKGEVATGGSASVGSSGPGESSGKVNVNTAGLAELSAYMKGDEVRIHVSLATGGTGSATVWGCDLTDGYVRINADYTT